MADSSCAEFTTRAACGEMVPRVPVDKSTTFNVVAFLSNSVSAWPRTNGAEFCTTSTCDCVVVVVTVKTEGKKKKKTKKKKEKKKKKTV
jgi:hypothetical protein